MVVGDKMGETKPHVSTFLMCLLKSAPLPSDAHSLPLTHSTSHSLQPVCHPEIPAEAPSRTPLSPERGNTSNPTKSSYLNLPTQEPLPLEPVHNSDDDDDTDHYHKPCGDIDKGLDDVVPAHFLRSSPRRPLQSQQQHDPMPAGRMIISVPPELEEDSPMKRIRRGV